MDDRALGETYDARTEALMDAAYAAERGSLDRGIKAWQDVVRAAPALRGPRRQLARVCRLAERWNALADALKEEVEKTPVLTPDDKVPLLHELVEVYRDRLHVDALVLNTLNKILQLKPDDVLALEGLADLYERQQRWRDLAATLLRKAGVLEARLAAGQARRGEVTTLLLRAAGVLIDKVRDKAAAGPVCDHVLELDPGNAEAQSLLRKRYERRGDR